MARPRCRGSTIRGYRQALPPRNPAAPTLEHLPYTLLMDAMARVLASMSRDDTAAALRLLKVLEECGQMTVVEAEEWQRRITGWAWFNEVGTAAEPNA